MTIKQIPIVVLVPSIVYTSPGVPTDGGGFVIYLGADGKLHIKPVPPGPDGPLRTLVTAAGLVGTVAGKAGFAEVATAAEKVFINAANTVAREVAI